MKNLQWTEGVKKTPAIARSAELLDAYFDGEASRISSGLRTAYDQTAIILKKIAKYKLENEFPEIQENIGAKPEHTVHIEELNRDLYYWQRAWSKLLQMGYIVNPPLPAEVLFDYFRPGSDWNKKGEIIEISPHQRGLAFDIDGEERLLEKSKCVLKAKQDDSCFISDFLIEHINNAIHIGVKQIGDGTG